MTRSVISKLTAKSVLDRKPISIAKEDSVEEISYRSKEFDEEKT
jgi:hypothetical protein